MAANAASLQVSNRYQQMMARLAVAVTALAAARWTRMESSDLDTSYATWLSSMVPIVETAQRQGAAISDGYAKAFVRSETGQPADPRSIDPGSFSGSLVEGKTLSEALTPPLFTIKKMIGDGHSPDASLTSGLHRAQRSVSDHVLFKTRYALDAAIANQPRILGYRRVCQPTACGACLAAATGAIQHEAETLPCHPSCQCFKEPVVSGVGDSFRRPSGHEIYMGMNPAAQSRLFGADGGEIARLIQEGAVPFTALVQRQATATGSAWITQAPLETLLAHSPDA